MPRKAIMPGCRSAGDGNRPPGRAGGFLLAAAVCLLGLLPGGPAAAVPQKAAVFPSELVDTSTEGAYGGARADQTARLALITRTLAEGLAASGDYVVVDTAPEAAAIEAASPLRTCNGCEIDIARRLGADVAVIAVVQKVSNLILDLHVYVRAVPGGEVLRYGSTSIRGNTDESWTRGVRWLLAHRILKNEAPGGAAVAP